MSELRFTGKELALITTVLSTSKIALLKHLRDLPADTPTSKLKPFWEFDDRVGALLDKIRNNRKKKQKKS
jgi:hypothetical protein